MPHVEGKLRQVHLNVVIVLIPTEERGNGKAVAKILNAGAMAAAVANTSSYKQFLQTAVKRITCGWRILISYRNSGDWGKFDLICDLSYPTVA